MQKHLLLLALIITAQQSTAFEKLPFQEAKNIFFRIVGKHNNDQDNTQLLGAIKLALQFRPILIEEKGGWQDCTALWHACDENNGALATLLVEHKADVNKKEYYTRETPLHQAAARGNVPLVATLLANNALPNAIDERSMTPLNSAVCANRTSVVKMLLLHNAEAGYYNTIGDALPRALKYTKNESTDARHLATLHFLLAADAHHKPYCFKPAKQVCTTCQKMPSIAKQRNLVKKVAIFYQESHLLEDIKSLIGEYVGVPFGKDVFEIAESYSNTQKAKRPRHSSSPETSS